MENAIKIELFGMQKTTINGEVYMSYRTKIKSGKNIAVKFTRNVTEIPDFVHGYIYVNDNDIELSETGRFPTFWVNNIVAMEEEETVKKSVRDLF